MSLKENQTNKKALQAKNMANQIKQGLKARKLSRKPKKEKKKKDCDRQCKMLSPTTIGINPALAKSQQNKKKKTKNASEVTCYN